MSVQGLDDKIVSQICLVVDDAEGIARHYCEIFGLEMPEVHYLDASHEETRAIHKGSPTDATAKIATWQFGQVQFEIIEPVSGPSAWKDFLDEHGNGIHHIAFRVKGSDEVAESFARFDLGIAMQGRFSGGARGMYTYLDTQSALGTTIELLEFFDRE
ncbi:MAG: VOC family protein [Anaerolineae bacterium]|nr:VOC family protein [Anaerolineae bacterium]